MTAITPLPRDANGQLSAFANSSGQASAVQMDATGNVPIAVAGGGALASGSVTRPANTTAYAAGEVIGTATTDVIAIAGVARLPGGSGLVTDALVIDQGGAAAAVALEVYLFSVTPTAQADQTAFALSSTDLAGLIAIVPLNVSYVTNAGAGTTGSRVYTATGINTGFVCASGSEALYAVLVVRAAYTPVSGEQLTVVLKVVQD